VSHLLLQQSSSTYFNIIWTQWSKYAKPQGAVSLGCVSLISQDFPSALLAVLH
jgi:lipoprotein-anchoring transpeptidase ErfK/SrfK